MFLRGLGFRVEGLGSRGFGAFGGLGGGLELRSLV